MLSQSLITLTEKSMDKSTSLFSLNFITPAIIVTYKNEILLTQYEIILADYEIFA